MARPGLGHAAGPIWNEAQLVWKVGDESTLDFVAIETDALGSAHIFFLADENGGPRLLYHIRDDEVGVGEPVDIAVGVGVYRVAAHPMGRLHLIYGSDNNRYLYRIVDAPLAGDASAWSRATELTNASVNAGFGFAIDQAGLGSFCYARDQGVYLRRLTAAEGSWSEEQLVYAMSELGDVPIDVICSAASEPAQVVAWARATAPDYYPTQGLYAATSNDWGASLGGSG